MTYSDLISILPLIFLTVWACVLPAGGFVHTEGPQGWTALLAAVGLAAAMGLTLLYAGQASFAFSGMIGLDGFASFLDVLFLATGLFGMALRVRLPHSAMRLERGEYYALLLFSVAGMMLMAQAAKLIRPSSWRWNCYPSRSTCWLPLPARAWISEEAGLKYFLLGAFSTGFVRLRHRPGLRGHRTTQLTQIVSAVAGTAPGRQSSPC